MKLNKFSLELKIRKSSLDVFKNLFVDHSGLIIAIFLIALSITSYVAFYDNGLGLAYNDARSRLDIGRRVVEGLNPGLAQLGSVWLPLLHFLMIPTIWSDFMWHSGLSGALISMISFVGTGLLIYTILQKLDVGTVGRYFGVLVFAANLNILYLQSTAMTELLLLATMTAGSYYLIRWSENREVLPLIKAAFWIMLATLTRYDAWFLFGFAGLVVAGLSFWRKGYKEAEGASIIFGTLAGIGILGWFFWNLLIFGDPLYFAFGEFSARAQQKQIEEAGELVTKGNVLFSLKVYLYALIYNSGLYATLLSGVGVILFWFDKKIKPDVKIASFALITPLVFNILALLLGHSVLFVQGLSGDTWFNVRYGIMLMPTIAIFMGYLVEKIKPARSIVIGLFLFVTFFAFSSTDAVTIDDATVGSSQKNVSEVSGWLRENATNEDGFVMISAASHDAIIFSSGLPMSKFIHEGTGIYWDSATVAPDKWARWIILRSNDLNDLTFREIRNTNGFKKYELVESYPFADIYELKDEYLSTLNTQPVFENVK